MARDRPCLATDTGIICHKRDAVCLNVLHTQHGTELRARLLGAQGVTRMLACAMVAAAAYHWVYALWRQLPHAVANNAALLKGQLLPWALPFFLPTQLPAMVLLLAAVALLLSLFRVIRESVLVLPGGAGYILESKRRCGLLSRRFIDARDVQFVTLSEAVTSGDVRFFLAFALRDETGAGDGPLAVPFENLLPRMRLRHLTAAYRVLAPPAVREADAAAQAGASVEAMEGGT